MNTTYKYLKEEAYEANLQLPEMGLVLFTFGNEINTKKKLQLFGGNIRLSSPIGSLSMEKEYFNDNKNPNKIEEIDVLIIGINTVHWMDV